MEKKNRKSQLNSYVVNLKGGYGSKCVQAYSHGGAKYAAYVDYDVTGGLGFGAYLKWVESVHLLHRFRPSDLYGDRERFERVRGYRNLPFAYIGQRVILHSKSRGDLCGIICGSNHAQNLDILFDGQSWTENCHPYYQLDYLGPDGEVVASFRE